MEKNLINTLLSGVVIFKLGTDYVFVKPSSAEEKSFADFLSYEVYEESILEGIFTEDEMNEWIISIGLWSKEEDEQIDELRDNLENMKVDYFNNFRHEQSKDYIKKAIDGVQKKLIGLFRKKSIFADKTCEYIQSYCFTSYILEKNAFLQDNTPAINKFDMSSLFNRYSDSISKIQSEIRLIAKSNEWRSIWHTSKNHHVFSNSPSSLISEQTALISWSQYYDNVYQSMEKPSDDVIQDDLALDGWATKQARKRKEEEKQRNAEAVGSDKIKNAGEIILPARNKKEVNEILALNNAEGKRALKDLSRDLKTGSKKDSELTSVRQSIQMESNKMSMNRNRK